VKVDLVKTFQFEAAHRNAGRDARSSRLHGHSYRVEVVVSGECDSQLGWLVDYAEISDQFDPIYRTIDHRLLNDIEGLEDASLPGVRRWLLDRLRVRIGNLKDVKVEIVGPCAFRPRVLKSDAAAESIPRVVFGFEAAHFLPNVAPDHKCRRVHGHSFRVEVARNGPSEIEPALRRVYDALDHVCLNDIEGLPNATSENVARWIWDRLARDISGLSAVVVAETCTARCVYWGE
jgi:6-pyruvoyltetrahydropterin/6-carboxytetrahydropterin synthase